MELHSANPHMADDEKQTTVKELRRYTVVLQQVFPPKAHCHCGLTLY
jgi:hypothetical protein